ncbi:helix-turn-helix transcriptional regulator [Lachnospiraceae bacterium 29-84]
MTINERIRHFRKNVLHINQRQFAADLGMAQTGVSGLEQDGATVTDRAIKSICMAFNLNEDWLRNGTEPMYIQAPTFSLDNFVRQHGGTELELDIMKAYFELEPDTRAMLVQHFKERLTASRAESSEISGMTVEEAEAEYIKSRSKTAQNPGSSALNITADTKPGTASENGSNLASNQ